MADVLVGSERRALIGGYGLPGPAPPPPPPESLLGRLDQIDLRLRQLEEQRRPSHAADESIRRAPGGPAQHQHTKSLPSALQHVQLRGTLMDRLNLLESRIRQLSCELDLDAGVGGGKAGAGSYAALAGLGSSSSMAPQDRAWSESAPMLEPCRDPAAATCAPDRLAAAADESWSAVEIPQKGARQLHHRNKSNPPNKIAVQHIDPEVKSLKEAKCVCQKENRKAERNRTSRRWFTVGC